MTQKLPIPPAHNPEDGNALMIVCFPNSTHWRGILNGTIYRLTYGRTWDEKTGTITDVQAIAEDIFNGVCIMDCQDLIDAIEGISAVTDLTETNKLLKELIALIGSQSRDLTTAAPNNVDYSADGIRLPVSGIETHLGPHPAP